MYRKSLHEFFGKNFHHRSFTKVFEGHRRFMTGARTHRNVVRFQTLCSSELSSIRIEGGQIINNKCDSIHVHVYLHMMIISELV